MIQAQRSAQRHYNGKNMKSSKMQCGGLSRVNKGTHSQLFLTPEGWMFRKQGSHPNSNVLPTRQNGTLTAPSGQVLPGT